MEHQVGGDRFFFGPRALAFHEFARVRHRRFGRLPGDVNSMRSAFRAIRGQARRRADAAQASSDRQSDNLRARSNAAIAIARAVGSLQAWSNLPPSHSASDVGGVGHDRFEHRGRCAGHREQIGDRPAAAAGERHDAFAAGRVDSFDQFVLVRGGHSRDSLLRHLYSTDSRLLGSAVVWRIGNIGGARCFRQAACGHIRDTSISRGIRRMCGSAQAGTSVAYLRRP